MLIKYELSMPEIAWLVRQPKSSINMYYMSGSKNDTPLIQEIEMKIISETEPSQRLLKLIQRGHLVEAEVRIAFFFKYRTRPLSKVYLYFYSGICESVRAQPAANF
jgi:hypothetical protein